MTLNVIGNFVIKKKDVPTEEEWQHLEADNGLRVEVKVKTILNMLLPYPFGESIPKIPHAVIS
jgi:hypothetical protein